MGNGLHLSLVQGKGGFQQCFPVSGGTAPGNPGRAGQHGFQIPDGGFGRFDGVSLIIGVEGIQQLALLANEGQFGCGGTGINAQITVTAVGFQIFLSHYRLTVTLPEGIVILLIFKQRRKSGHFKRNRYPLFQSADQLLQGNRRGITAFQRGTHGGKQVGILRIHHVFRCQLQCTDKGFFQFRQKMQRAAQKRHTAPNGLAAGQAGNGLIHHRLKNRGRQIRVCGPLVNQGLDVRLREHTTAGGNGIDLPVVFCLFVQAPGVNLQQRGHLIDEGAGTAGADTVHPLLQAAGEIDDFRILTAQLNCHIRLRIVVFQGRSHGHHFLHKTDVHRLCQGDGAGTGDLHLQQALPQLLTGIPEKLCQSALGVGLMAAVIPIDQMILFVQNRQLYGGGTDVNSCTIGVHSSSLSMLSM